MNSIDLINKHNLTLKIESELYPELKIFLEDENYEDAQSKMEECVDTYKEDILSKTEAPAEYEEYENNLYNKTINYIRTMSKSELEEAIIEILNIAPEWVYDRFVRDYVEL